MRTKSILTTRWLASLPLIIALLTLVAGWANATTRIKQDNATALNLAGSWDTIPGSSDIAQWDSTVTAARSCALGADTTWQGIILTSPGGNQTITGANTLTLGAATVDISMNTAAKDLTINCNLSVAGGANVWRVNGGQTLTIGGNVSGANTVTINTGTGTVKVTGNISQITGLTMNIAGGTTLLSGTDTYTSGTTITAGTLTFLNTAAKPSSGTTTVAANATIGLGVGGSGFFSSTDLNNLFANTLSGVSMNAASIVAVDTTAGDFSHSSAIGSSTYGLTKLGVNTLTLPGGSGYTGGTTVTAGTLTLNGDQSAANGGIIVDCSVNPLSTLNISSGATVAVGSTKAFRVGHATTAATLGGTANVAGTVNNSGTLTVGRSGTLNLNSGTVWSQSGDATVQGQGNVTATMNVNGGATFAYTSANTFKLNNPNGNYNASGTPVLTVKGNFTTGKAIENSTTTTSGNAARSQLTLDGGTLKFTADVTDFIFSSTATPILCVLNSTSTIDTDTHAVGNSTVSITGAGGLTKIGAGTLTIGVAEAYTGNTTISVGTLTLSGSGAIDTSPTVAVASGATFNILSAGFNRTSGQTLTGAGSVAGGTVTVAGKLAPGDAGVCGTLSLNALTLNSGSTADFEFPTSGANDLVSISGALTISGATTINLYQVGTTSAFAQNGTYNLFQYGSGTPNTANLAVGNPQVGKTYTFDTSGGYVRVKIETGAVVAYWAVDSDGSWGTAANWSPGVPDAVGAAANFDNSIINPYAGPRAVALDADRTAGAITFNSAQNFTINAGSPGSSKLVIDNSPNPPVITGTLGSSTVNAAVTLPAANVSVSVAGSASVTLNGAIDGTGPITKTGNGTLTLGGANTYSGGNTLSAGTLALSGSGTLGNTAALNVNGGTLDLGGLTTPTAGAVTIAGGTIQNGTLTGSSFAGQSGTVSANATLAGSGAALTKTTTGTLTLSGANSYGGGTVVSAGTLAVSADNDLGAVPGSATPGNVVINGGTLASSGTFTLDAKRGLAIGPASGSGSGTIDTATNLAVIYAGIIANNGSGTGTLIVNPVGTGTNLLSGANTYTGGTILTNGSLTLQGDQSAASGGLSIADFGTAAYLNIASGASVAVASGKTFQIGKASASLHGASDNTVDVAGSVNNAGSLNVGIPETLNVKSGAVWSQSGDMMVAAYGNFGAAMNINSGAAFTYTGANTIKVNGPGATFNTKATLTISGSFTTGMGFEQTTTLTSGTGYGLVALSGGTLTLSAAVPNLFFGTSGGVRCTLANACKIDTGANNSTITNAISGGGSLTKLGTGALSLSGPSTYTGNTTNSAGTVNLGVAEIAGTSGPLGKPTTAAGSITLSGGTLQYSSVNQYDYSSRFSTAANQAYNVDTAGTNVTWATPLTSSGGTLTKSGLGTLTLAAVAHTYSGATMINNGRLVGVVGGGCASSAVTVAATAGNTAALGVSITDNTKQWTCSSLSIDNSLNGGTSSGLDFNFGSQVPSQSLAPLNVIGTATFTTPPTVTVELANSGIGGAGTVYPLMMWSGSSVTPPSVTVTGSRVTAHTTVTGAGPGYTLNLVIDSNPEPLTWKSGGTGTWNTTDTDNWLDSTGAAATYSEATLPGDQVQFTDANISADTTVALHSTVTPASVAANNSSYNYTISGNGAILGNFNVTKSGTKQLTINAATTNSGGTVTVNSGILSFGSPAGLNLGFSGGTVNNGGTLSPNYATANGTYVNIPLTITGSGASGSHGALDLMPAASSLTWPGAITLSGGAKIGIYGSAPTYKLTGGIGGTGPLTLQGSGNSTTVAAIQLNTTACTYSGATDIKVNANIASFTVQLGINNALPVGTVLSLDIANANASGGVYLDLNGKNQQLAGLTWDGAYPLKTYAVINSSGAASVLTINNSAPCSFGGVIGTAGKADISLVMQGSSTLTLGGANTYTGNTTISGGTLEGAAASSVKGNVSVANGAFLKLSNASALDTTAALTLDATPSAGTVILNLSSGTQTISVLNFDGTPKAQGIWGGTGSGAEHESAAFNGSGFLAVTANPGGGATTTTLSPITPNPACAAAISLIATVSGNSPSGQVEFFDAGTSLGRTILSGGSATLSPALLSPGLHSAITAKYLGDDSNNQSTTSTPGSVTVNAAATAAAINGPTGSPTAIAINQLGVSYSVTPPNGSSTYAWTIPSDATMVGVATGPSITVTFGGASGSIGVTETTAGGCASAPLTLGVSVSSVNHAPIAPAAHQTMSAAKNTAASIYTGKLLVGATDADVPAQTLTVTAAGPGSIHGGTVSLAGNQVTYTPPTAIFTGSDSFTYTISDGNGGTALGTVDVTVADSASGAALNVVVAEQRGTDFYVQFAGIPGYHYRIQWCANAEGPYADFSPDPVILPAGTNGLFDFQEPMVSGRFYKTTYDSGP